MATIRMKPRTKACLGAAAVIAFVSVLFFGNAVERVAEESSQCMEDVHRISECNHVDPWEFWGPIGFVSALGFFVGGVCFIYGRQQGERTSKLELSEVEKIVHAYAAAVLSRKSTISDASELPYPKAKIKAALIVAMLVTKDAKMREQLKSSFVSLADWQEGIGPGPHAFETTKADLDDPMAAAKRVAAAGPSFTAIPATVAAEAGALLDELRALGV
jgi:hypothetical protein